MITLLNRVWEALEELCMGHNRNSVVIRKLVAGHKVVVVSSGAVGVGCQRLGLSARPQELSKRQALAAAGQVHLMRFYDDFFTAIGVVSCLESFEKREPES